MSSCHRMADAQKAGACVHVANGLLVWLSYACHGKAGVSEHELTDNLLTIVIFSTSVAAIGA